MDDPVAVGVLEGVGDLPGQAQRVGHGKRAAQGLPLHVLHDQVVGSHVEQRADVGVVEGGDREGLVAEALLEGFLRDLDRDGPLQPGVAGLVHLAHPARAHGAHDLVGTKACSGRD